MSRRSQDCCQLRYRIQLIRRLLEKAHQSSKSQIVGANTSSDVEIWFVGLMIDTFKAKRWLYFLHENCVVIGLHESLQKFVQFVIASQQACFATLKSLPAFRWFCLSQIGKKLTKDEKLERLKSILTFQAFF